MPAPTPAAQRVGEVLTGAAAGLAAVALEGAALALHTVNAVIWPVQTAADTMTRAVCSAGGVGDLGPWLPASVRMVPASRDPHVEHAGQAAVRRHLAAIPSPRAGRAARQPVARGTGG